MQALQGHMNHKVERWRKDIPTQAVQAAISANALTLRSPCRYPPHPQVSPTLRQSIENNSRQERSAISTRGTVEHPQHPLQLSMPDFADFARTWPFRLLVSQ